MDMTLSFIIAVALSTVLMLIIIGLVVALAYYRWRTTELMSGITEFIYKNWKMEQRIGQLEKEKTYFPNLGHFFPPVRHLFPEDAVLLQSNNIFHS